VISEEGLQAGGFRNVLNLHEFFRGQFALSGLDQQVNFAAPRRWRSLHVAIFAAVWGCVGLLSGCNEFNPNLGAAATQSSSITYITPSSRPAGCSGFTLDIMGSGFVNGAVVAWNGSARTTDFESATELLATINTSDLATETPVTIVVSTPPVVGVPKGNTLSNFVPFTIAPVVTSGSCPIPPSFPPTLIALSQPSGDAGTSIEIAGNYFGGVQNDSTVTFGGVAATPTAWSGTLITVPVPTGAPVGSVMVVVTVSGVASITLDPGENVFNVLPTPTTTGSSLSLAATADAVRSFSSTAAPRYRAVVAPSADPAAAGGTGMDKVYLRDTCQGVASGCTPATILISVGFDGTEANGASRSPSISTNGRFVAFASDANNLVRGDANGLTDIFLRDTCIAAPAGCLPSTTRVSTGAGGVDANGASASPSISSDGRFVDFYSMATDLVLDGAANSPEVPAGAYLWDSCFGVANGCKASLTRLKVNSASPR